jgi:hypothetical protein
MWLLHDEIDSAESHAAAEWYGRMIEHAAAEMRLLFSEHLRVADRESIFFARHFVRLPPERAREFHDRIDALRNDLLAADDECAETRFAFTTTFIPVVWDDHLLETAVIRDNAGQAHAASGS